jgi:SAM-dependent methyltransferase
MARDDRLHRLLQRSLREGLGEAEVYREGLAAPLVEDAPAAPPTTEGRFVCPICETAADAFLPFGLAQRPDAQCPSCGSIERHRMLWLYLRDFTDHLERPCRVLHTAPEPALAARLRRIHGRGYVAVDRFDPAADVAADLKALPFSDGAFDLVLSSHVLEHVAHDRPAIAELARVLTPGGRALVMVPYDPERPTYEDPSITTPEGRMAAFGHPFHHRIYGRDLPDRLRAAGLEARVFATRDLFDAAARKHFRLNRNHLLDCLKTE